MASRTTLRGIALVSVSTVIWGMGGLFTRLLPFDLWTIIFWRGVFATIFVGVYAYWRFGRGLPARIAGAGGAGGLVALAVFGTIVLFPAAFQLTTVAKAFMILSALPFVTALVAWLWLREVPSGLTLLAGLVAAGGVFIMVGPSSGGLQTGDLLAVAGTLTQSVATVAIRRNPQVTMLPMIWVAQVLSVAAGAVLGQQLGALSARDYAVAAGFGLGPMTLGIVAYVAGSALIPASLTALIGIAEGPIGGIWAWVGVGERPDGPTLIGGAVVLAAVVGRILLGRPKD
ncbi:MAG: DMT family transporter [Pseudomonadota bacterium]